MIFPLEELVKFQDNIYEITAAASQLFKDEVEYRIEN